MGLEVKKLNDFYQKLRTGGVALQHQYQLLIDPPLGSPQNVVEAFRDVTMWAQSATVPSRTQNFADIQYLGFPFNVPSNFEMSNEISFTINTQKTMDVRHALLAWMNNISGADILGGQSGGGDKSLNELNVAGTAKIVLLDDKFEDGKFTYELVGFYPTVVGEAEVTNTAAEIVTFEATFKYQFWRVLKGVPNEADNGSQELKVFKAIGDED
jgi:hypothetical protein